MSNKMALDALTAALDAMEHMANTLNNMDAVDEDEDAQHDAAFEAVRLAIAQLEQPQKSRIVAASMNSYPEADQRFFNFWYGHMFEDLMQPPLVGIDHATARYIWNAAEGAAIAALQAEPQPEQTASISLGPVAFEFAHFQQWVNKASTWFGALHEANSNAAQRRYLCIDAAGRVCMIGRDFSRARDEGKFPVRVHLIDALPATTPKD